MTVSAAGEPATEPTTTSPLNELVRPAGPVPLEAIASVPDRTASASPAPAPSAIELPVSRSVPDPEVIRVAVPETFPAKVSDVAGFTTSIAPAVPEVENPRFVVAVTPV